ncbi:MAG: preprotein translocase subunit YajC [Myxococcaceae bacterium]|nr:preprotein translocase subunit YajC [Myxococcaceae bacterium]MBH2005944.1 preprotein translocase subunit YajC [Myxococcaceae bacterium]
MSELFGQSGADGGGIVSMLFMFGGMFAIMYFILIRPQQKQQKKHQELIASLKKGDEVVLNSGICGRIFSVEDKYLVLELMDKNKVKVLKHAVQGLMAA